MGEPKPIPKGVRLAYAFIQKLVWRLGKWTKNRKRYWT